MVPLTQANLTASARSIAASLGLDASDRCLNVMPLFHIHGLVGALLTTMVTGGSIVCTPGFQAPRFLDWCDEFAPTWYTAVPTMHQAVLSRATENPARVANSRLRFIRSCSAPLPPKLMAEMEQTFRVPVLEAYGMTEASHQIATNPPPPAARKPGSVGLASGTEVAVMDGEGNLLAPEEIGEIVLRGPGVTAGYANNPDANRTVVHQRMVPHRRQRKDRSRGLPVHYRSSQGDHQSRRPENIAPRNRRGPRHSSRSRQCGCVRDSGQSPRRGCGGRGRASPGTRGD